MNRRYFLLYFILFVSILSISLYFLKIEKGIFADIVCDTKELFGKKCDPVSIKSIENTVTENQDTFLSSENEPSPNRGGDIDTNANTRTELISVQDVSEDKGFVYAGISKSELDLYLAAFRQDILSSLPQNEQKIIYVDKSSTRENTDMNEVSRLITANIESVLDSINERIKQKISGGTSDFDGASLVISNNGVFGGTVTAQSFIGDGSQLTGLGSLASASDLSAYNIFSNGTNVGIGTATFNSSDMLTIAGDLKVFGNSVYRYDLGSSIWSAQVDVGSDTNGTGELARINLNEADDVLAQLVAGRGSSQYKGYLAFNTRNGTPIERMRIDENGNVGIGTSTPSTKLDILGNTKMQGTGGDIALTVIGANASPLFPVMTAFYDTDPIAVGNGAGIILGGKDTATSYAGWGAIKGIKANTINDDESGGIALWYRPWNGSMSEGMRIDYTGNVGIGTTTPSAKFTVKGSGTTTGLLAQFTDSANTTRLTIQDGGNVGIGTNAPTYPLELISRGTNDAMRISTFGNTSFWGSNIVTTRARGTSAAPTAVLLGDALFGVYAGGYTGTSDALNKAAIRMTATQNFSSSANGTLIDFSTTPNNSTARAVRMTINHDGNVGIGTTVPGQKLSVVGSASIIGETSTTPGSLLIASGGSTNANSLLLRNSITGGTTLLSLTTSADASAATITSFSRLQLVSGSGHNVTTGGGNFGVLTGAYPASPLTVNGGAAIGATYVSTVAPTNGLIVEGNIGVGTTTPSQKLSVVGNAQFTGVTSGAYAFDLNLTATGVLTTASSDRRLKENITLLDTTSTLEKLIQLKPSEFNWKSNSVHDLGLIAQEVEEIFPELVFQNPTDGFKGINYSRLIPILIASVQEMYQKITSVFDGTARIKVEEICVGNTCLTEEQLIKLLEKDSSYTPSTSGSDTSTSTSSDTETSTSTSPTIELEPGSEAETQSEPEQVDVQKNIVEDSIEEVQETTEAPPATEVSDTTPVTDTSDMAPTTDTVE